jgi:formate/nitrite transporter FocA (FNT family)
MNYLTVMVHLEPPVAHDSSSRHVFDRKYNQVFMWSEMLFEFYGNIMGGSIAAITNWPHYGDYHLAPLR